MEKIYQTPTPFKKEYTYVKGEESHLVRRRMIMKDHPEIAALLVDNQPYTIIISLSLVTLNLAIAYAVKVYILTLRTCQLGSS